MFFLARSALCIGLVSAAASTAGGSTVGAALDGGTREAVRAAGQACIRSTDCLRIGAELLAPVVMPVPVPQTATRNSPPASPVRMPATRRAAATRDAGIPKG